jgi:hypothetical protein
MEEKFAKTGSGVCDTRSIENGVFIDGQRNGNVLGLCFYLQIDMNTIDYERSLI